MKLLIKEQQESYENVKFYYICREKFGDKYAKGNKILQVRDHCHYTGEYTGVPHSIRNLERSVAEQFL